MASLSPTNTFILTFDLAELPKRIQLTRWMLVSVDAYIPSPLRCFNCQLFGHHKDRCRRDVVCARCGVAKHNNDSCTETEHCVNCDGKHSAFSRNCPKWKAEQEVVRIKHTQNISFPEARKLVQTPETPTPGLSYATAAQTQKQTTTTATQTEVTWSPKKQETTITWSYNTPHYKPTSSTSSSQTTQSQHSSKKETHIGRSPKASPKKAGPPDKPKQRPTPKEKVQTKDTTRPAKGAADPVKLHNKFGGLDQMDTEMSPPDQTPKPVIPRKPVLAP